jgi:hypothetical protein
MPPSGGDAIATSGAELANVNFQTCPLLQQAGGKGMGGAKTPCLREPMFVVGFARSFLLLVAAEGFF